MANKNAIHIKLIVLYRRAELQFDSVDYILQFVFQALIINLSLFTQSQNEWKCQAFWPISRYTHWNCETVTERDGTRRIVRLFCSLINVQTAKEKKPLALAAVSFAQPLIHDIESCWVEGGKHQPQGWGGFGLSFVHVKRIQRRRVFLFCY